MNDIEAACEEISRTLNSVQLKKNDVHYGEGPFVSSPLNLIHC
jgi:hypothetical protein